MGVVTDTMHASADFTIAGVTAPAAASSRVDRRVDAALPTIRTATVLVYIAVACVCLLPGMLGAAGIVLPAETAVGAFHRHVLRQLDDIRFGEGLRFWLGVTGATMMALLLLYPLRKAFARGRLLGSVRGWFHAHLVMGLFGPVLVLYHANFGHGALNANVALWSMLVVVVSGLLGHFVYTRVSAHFYGDKRKARELLDDTVAGVRGLEARPAAIQALIQKLEACETRLLAPRRGIVASVLARMRASLYRRQFHKELSALISAAGSEQRWTAAHGRQRSQHLHGLLGQYMDSVRSAAGRSVLEQVWARWRLFHLPVFLIMLVAAVLHVIAVWGMDAAPRDGVPVDITQAPARPAMAAAPPVSDPIADVLAANEIANASPSASTSRSDAAPRPVPTMDGAPGFDATDARPVATVAPFPSVPPSVIRRMDTPVAPLVASPPSSDDVLGRLVDMPRQVSAPRQTEDAAPPSSSRSEAAPKRPLSRPAPVKTMAMPATPSQVVPPRANSSPAQATAPVIEATYAELQKRTQQPPPMGLGASTSQRVLSLTERIAELKARNFDHGTTKFPLTGKHTKVGCADCHTTTLENTPRECVACHKADDPHRGRRPDCARCHTTNRWTQILRR